MKPAFVHFLSLVARALLVIAFVAGSIIAPAHAASMVDDGAVAPYSEPCPMMGGMVHMVAADPSEDVDLDPLRADMSCCPGPAFDPGQKLLVPGPVLTAFEAPHLSHVGSALAAPPVEPHPPRA